MDTTSLSLLSRLRDADNAAAWNRFVDLYTPLLFFWARKAGLEQHDAADLVQDVFALLLQKLPEFEYQAKSGRSGRFRAWLRRVTLNKWCDRKRRTTAENMQADDSRWDELVEPDAAEAFWREEYDQHLVARALEIMQAEFEPSSWKACWEVKVNGRKASDVASELGLSEGAVYVATSRVLRRLRAELAEFLEE